MKRDVWIVMALHGKDDAILTWPVDVWPDPHSAEQRIAELTEGYSSFLRQLAPLELDHYGTVARLGEALADERLADELRYLRPAHALDGLRWFIQSAPMEDGV